LWIKAYKPQVFVPMLIEIDIQGVLAVRATGATVLPPWHYGCKKGDLCAVKLTAPTLRRRVFFGTTAIDVLLVPSQQLPPVLLENGLTLAGLSTESRKDFRK